MKGNEINVCFIPFFIFSICGTLHSVDQYLNIKLTDINVTDTEKYPHMVSFSPFIYQEDTSLILNILYHITEFYQKGSAGPKGMKGQLFSFFFLSFSWC